MTLSITYYAATENLGDVNEQGAEDFRNWVFEQLKTAYKDAAIDVLNEQAIQSIVITGENSVNEYDDVFDFADRLSDKCPWDF